MFFLNYFFLDFREYIQQAAVPRRWATHGGEDVPLYATGAGAAVFSGVLDQTFIPFGIAYAACIGPMRRLCEEHREEARMMIGTGGRCETNGATAISSSRSINSIDHHEDHDKDNVGESMRRLHSAIPIADGENEQTSTSLLEFFRYHWELSSASSSSTTTSSQTSLILIVQLCIHLLATWWCWCFSIYLSCT